MRPTMKVGYIVRKVDPNKPFNLDDRRYYYTMLVAWHKFDRYERWILSGLLKTTIDKLPFLKVGDVCTALYNHEKPIWLRKLNSSKSEIPYKDWRIRIQRAATKKERQRRQRIKV